MNEFIRTDGVLNGVSAQEGRRVGSSLLTHDCSSFALGAASAYEFDAVNNVNVNFFCNRNSSGIHQYINTSRYKII